MTTDILTYRLPAEPDGEGLRAEIEAALGLPVTEILTPSPVMVYAVEDTLRVVVEHGGEALPEAMRAKIDAVTAARHLRPRRR